VESGWEGVSLHDEPLKVVCTCNPSTREAGARG
jgi:hypothetical protein